MIEAHWKRIAGLKTLDDGTAAIVWVAHDHERSVLQVYDTCLWKGETFAHICQGIANRSRWVPVAWSNKAFADELLSRGVNMLPDPVPEDPAYASVQTTAVWELMRTKQFQVKRGLKEWADEFKSFNKQEGKVPLDSHPLMAATWYAVSQLPYARAEQAYRSSKKTFPKIAMV